MEASTTEITAQTRGHFNSAIAFVERTIFNDSSASLQTFDSPTYLADDCNLINIGEESSVYFLRMAIRYVLIHHYIECYHKTSQSLVKVACEE